MTRFVVPSSFLLLAGLAALPPTIGCGGPSATRVPAPAPADAAAVSADSPPGADLDARPAPPHGEPEPPSDTASAGPWIEGLTGYPEEVMRQVEALHVLLDEAIAEERSAPSAEARLAVGRRLMAKLGRDSAPLLEYEWGVDTTAAIIVDSLRRIGPAERYPNLGADTQVTLMRDLATMAGPSLSALFQWFVDHTTDPAILQHARGIVDSLGTPATP
jgi:hypothetical protein